MVWSPVHSARSFQSKLANRVHVHVCCTRERAANRRKDQYAGKSLFSIPESPSEKKPFAYVDTVSVRRLRAWSGSSPEGYAEAAAEGRRQICIHSHIAYVREAINQQKEQLRGRFVVSSAIAIMRLLSLASFLAIMGNTYAYMAAAGSRHPAPHAAATASRHASSARMQMEVHASMNASVSDARKPAARPLTADDG